MCAFNQSEGGVPEFIDFLEYDCQDGCNCRGHFIVRLTIIKYG